MSKKDFDIESLLHFAPPRYFCEKCYGIFSETFSDYKAKEILCPICKVKYIPTKEYSNVWKLGGYLDDAGFGIKFDKLFEHCKRLAIIVNETQKYMSNRDNPWIEKYLPMRALLDSLLNAQKFIHFSSYGISMILFGALKMIAQRINIRGIIANVKPDQCDELTKYNDEAPKLELKIFERGIEQKKKISVPHQKFIIIDGLMAFKGSANLTLEGWRKFAKGHEIIEYVTSVKEVIELNNQYFSPIWAESKEIKEIKMEVAAAPF